MKKQFAFALFALTSLLFIACGSTKVEAVPEDETETTKVEEKQENQKEDKKEEVADFSASNAELLEKVEAARKAAIEAGAEKYYKAFLAETDVKYAGVKINVKVNPSANYTEDLNDLIKRYESMEYAALAMGLKEKASGLNSSDLDAATLKKGSDALAKYSELTNGGASSDLLAQAKLAYQSYSDLVNKGFSAMAGRERKAALEAKKNAESVKAQVAKKTKEDYKKAADTFKKADSSYSLKKIEPAYNGYKASKEAWTTMFEIVKKDREETEARLAAAKQKVLEAEQAALAADTEAPLTEKVAGIEDENAVLLEADKFANPEDSISDVESGTVAETAGKIANEAIAAEEMIDAK